MAYCTRQDLVDRIGEALLVELSDLEREGQANEARIAAAIADADAEIDSYARARYDVPLSPVPASVKAIAVDLVIYRLLAARGFDKASADEAVVDQHKAAIDWLQRLASGQVTLGVERPAKDQGATVTAASRIFSRTSMEDL